MSNAFLPPHRRTLILPVLLMHFHKCTKYDLIQSQHDLIAQGSYLPDFWHYLHFWHIGHSSWGRDALSLYPILFELSLLLSFLGPFVWQLWAHPFLAFLFMLQLSWASKLIDLFANFIVFWDLLMKNRSLLILVHQLAEASVNSRGSEKETSL